MTEDQQFAVDGPVLVEVRVASGDVSISTADVDAARVSLSGPQKVLDATTVTLRGRTLSIKQAKDRGLMALLGAADIRGFMEGGLEIEIVVPHGSSADLASAAGDAHLLGEFVELTTKSASGDLDVRGEVVGDVTAKGVSGDVQLQHVGGDVRAQTVSGDVVVAAVDGSANVTTVSGDVTLRSLQAGSVHVQTVSGDVALGIARGICVDVDASSASGDMSSDVPLSGEPVNGDGSMVVIRARTVSGDVHIMRAPEREPLLRS
jgi:DUF4097 and DUF4098 domain-containing protein YvlB